MDNSTPLTFTPTQPGDVLRIQIPGGVIRIQAATRDEQGRTITLVDVLAANDERGGDEHGNVWDVTDGQARVRLTQRGPLMTNPESYGELVRDRLADLGLDGILDLGRDSVVRLGQIRTTQISGHDGKVDFLGGDRVLVGRSKITSDSYYYAVRSPRTKRERLVDARDVIIEDRAPRWAFWIDPAQDDRPTNGFMPSVVIEHVPGHWPLHGADGTRPWIWGSSLQEAKALCEQENLRRRITPIMAAEIVRTSIAASSAAASGSA